MTRVKRLPLLLSLAPAVLACAGAPERAASEPPRPAPPLLPAAAGLSETGAGVDPQAAPRSELTLDGAFALAEELHPRLHVSVARIDAARAALSGAGLRPDPTLVTGMQVAPVDKRTIANAEYVIGLALPVPLGDRRAAAVRAADAELERSIRSSALELLAVRAEVQGAFVAALHARDLVSLERELFELAEEGRALAEARLAAGDAVAAEVDAAAIAAARAGIELRAAEGLRERALRHLAASVGAPDLAIGSVAGELDSALELPTLASLLARLDAAPGLLAAAAGTRAAEERAALADAMRLPDVRVELLYHRQEEIDRDAFDLGIEVPLGVFDGGRGRARRARADAAVARAEERAARVDAEDELRAAHLVLAVALETLERVEEDLLPRHAALLENARVRRDAGDLAPSDLLAVRATELRARLDALAARRDVLAAWARLAPWIPR